MKHTKHLFLTLICILMLVVCLCFSSCGNKNKDTDTNSDSNISDTNTDSGNPGGDGDGHTHSYTAAITKNPSCSEVGITTYTCSCGDSYTEDIEAYGHDYEITVNKYPSSTEKGSKTYTCEREGCTYSEVKEIESLLVSLPDVSKLLAPLFEGGSYTMSIGENSKIIYTEEIVEHPFENGKKSFLTIEIAETKISSLNGVFAGHVKFAFKIATVELDGETDAADVLEPNEFDEFGSLYLYVNGDDISIELTEGEDKLSGNYDANQLIAMTIDSVFGMGYENALALMNIGVELKTYIPLLEGIVTSTGALLMPEYLASNIKLFATLLGDAIVSEEVDENGNTVYYLDIIALNEFLQEYTDATIAEIIDAQYGEGTTEALVEFINSVPDMKLKDVALSAIAFAENYDVNVETTYELINYIIYLATGEMMDIETEIEGRYDNTLAQVLAELAGKGVKDFDSDKFVENMKGFVESITSTIPSYTIDTLFNSIIYGDANYIPENATEPYSITAVIHGYIAQLENIVAISVTMNQEGAVVGINVNAGPVSVNYTDNGNGGYLVSVMMNGAELVNGTLTLSENGFALNGTLNAGGTALDFNATLDGADLTVSLSEDNETVFNLEATLDTENGTVSKAELKIYGYDKEYDENDEIIGETHCLQLTLAFKNNGDGTYKITAMAEGSATTIDVAIADGEITAKFVIMDTELNKLDADFDFTFKYEFDENGMPTYFAYIMDGYGYDNYNNTSNHIYFIFEASADELHVLMKQDDEEFCKIDLVASEGVLTQADIILNAISYVVDPELGYSVETLVNSLTLKYEYDVETSAGSLLVQVPARSFDFVADFDSDSLSAKLIDTREEEIYNNNIMFELNAQLDENGIIKEISFKMNTYDNIVYDPETYEEIAEFVNWIDCTITNGENGVVISFANRNGLNLTFTKEDLENGVSFDLLAKHEDITLLDGKISFTSENNSFTIDFDVDAPMFMGSHEEKEVNFDKDGEEYSEVISYSVIRSIFLDFSITFSYE